MNTFIHLPVATFVEAIAYLIRGVAGFGSGLIAIPLLALILPLSVVVPVIAMLDLLASISHCIGNDVMLTDKVSCGDSRFID